MNKTTIELNRAKHIQGYGHIGGPSYSNDSQSTMEALVKWSAIPEHAGKKICKYYVRTVEEPIDGPLSYHYASERGFSQEECAKLFDERIKSGRPAGEYESANALVVSCGMVYRMPLVHEVHYLDIYWQ